MDNRMVPLRSLSSLALPSSSASLRFAAVRMPTPPPLPLPRLQWIGVRPRFTQFDKTLALTLFQEVDAMKKRTGVISCLNRHYYGTSSEYDNGFAIGSWGRGTAMRPPRDIDLYFVLPVAVYYRFQNHWWNRQSALLQEVKEVLAETYPNTEMRGDGQVVIVRFDSFSVEVVPAFLLDNGRYWVCDTHGGGSYKEMAPWAEHAEINAIDEACSNNLRPLIRMLKAWQDYCSVPIKSFQLEYVAADFLRQSDWRNKDFFWFDWIVRDFFAYLYHRANGFAIMPGTLEEVFMGDAWQSRAASAYHRAVKACEHERDNLVEAAGEQWQKIFGSMIPKTI